MRLLSKLTLAFLLVLLSSPAFADDSSKPAEVARIVSQKQTREISRKFKLLNKRIANGIRAGLIPREKAPELKAIVKTLWDKKREFMSQNGAKVLTNDQLNQLQEMWKIAANKIGEAKNFPSENGKDPSTAPGPATPKS